MHPLILQAKARALAGEFIARQGAAAPDALAAAGLGVNDSLAACYEEAARLAWESLTLVGVWQGNPEAVARAEEVREAEDFEAALNPIRWQLGVIDSEAAKFGRVGVWDMVRALKRAAVPNYRRVRVSASAPTDVRRESLPPKAAWRAFKPGVVVGLDQRAPASLQGPADSALIGARGRATAPFLKARRLEGESGRAHEVGEALAFNAMLRHEADLIDNRRAELARRGWGSTRNELWRHLVVVQRKRVAKLRGAQGDARRAG